MNRSLMEISSPDGPEKAANTVSLFLDNLRDNADFADKLTQNGSLKHSGLGDRFYVKELNEFILARQLPIPPELNHQMNNMRARFEMGLFPEITRAWVTIDCDIFMWNYQTNDDLAYFDGIPNTIEKIALARPKSGVFQNHVQWLLVVGTTLDVVLLAVSVTNGELSVVPDPLFKVDLEGTVLSDIVTTSEGRIFFAASENLFELEYSDKGWFQRQCKKVNRSSSLLHTLVPFFTSVAEDIEHLVVDNSRHILYALTKKFSIQVFDLGAKGASCSKLTTINIGQIIHQANILTGGEHDVSFFSNIASLNVLPANRSRQLCLVAVTSKGVRLYFSVYPASQLQLVQQYNQQAAYTNQLVSQAEARPACIRLVHVRFAPGVCPSSVYRDSPDGVYMSYTDSCSSVMATSDRNVVWAMSNLYHPNNVHFTENMMELHVNGAVWAVTLTEDPMLSSCLPSPSSDILPPVEPHSFFQLAIKNSPNLLIFTSEGLNIYEHCSPVRILRDALFDKGADGDGVNRLWQRLGATDVLVLALMLLTSEKPVDQSVKEKAIRLFFSWKDEPEMVDADMVHREQQQWSNNDQSIADWQHRIRSPLQASTPFGERPALSPMQSPFASTDASFLHSNAYYQFRPSKRHDALYSYFCRLMAPIWNVPLLQAQDKMVWCPVSESDLEWLSNQLRLLLAVIDDHGLIPRQQNPSKADHSLQAKFHAEALSRERSSLLALRSLIINTFETLSLWAVAVSHGIHAIASSFDSQGIRNLCGRRLCELCCENVHHNTELIKALIKYFLGDEAGTRELSNRLRAVCPTLYSQEDALVTNATEIMERAAKLGPGADSRRLVDSAMSLLRQSVHKLALSAVCEKLAQLKAFDCIVELAVLRAKKDDPKQLALIAYRNELGDGDRETANASQKREESYRVITKTLDDLEHTSPSVTSADQNVHRDLIIQCVLNSDDELAHASLFRWLVARSRTSVILQSKSAYVEQFLTHEISRGGGHKYLDLLWRFYERSGAFSKAAKLLCKLADSESPEVTLNYRVSYLSHAIMCAQSAQDSASKASIQEMRDKLDVANIQLSAKEALEELGVDGAVAARSLDRQLLSLQDLCVRYARAYSLWKVQLAIFRCANYYEQDTVENVWMNIITSEIGTGDSGLENRLLTCLADLALLYAPSNYFPTEFILVTLLGKCFENHVSPHFFVDLINKVNISCSVFLDCLTNEYRTGDPFWKENARARRYVIDTGIAVIEAFLEQASRMNVQKRSSMAAECAACISLFSLDIRSVSAGAPTELQTQLDLLNHRISSIA